MAMIDVSRIPDFERRKTKYSPIAALLDEVFGWPDWRPFLPPVDELVDCILSQSTNDRNRDRAFAALKTAFPTWEAVMNAPTEDVIAAIRPAGLANQKGPRIQNVLRRIEVERGELNIDFLADLPLEQAKAWLTALDGVGPKTAAIVLCFAFQRPAFPVDTHIHRIGQRIGFLPQGISADAAHVVMEAIVPPEDHFAFHLNLIRLGREICEARRPRCEICPLIAHCDFYQAASK
ncbi:MAG: endonuclease III [Chloroflexi bacterium]|nr:endonuclease III [Chloroflexota bacterium]